jgi:hypothetical protein
MDFKKRLQNLFIVAASAAFVLSRDYRAPAATGLAGTTFASSIRLSRL